MRRRHPVFGVCAAFVAVVAVGVSGCAVPTGGRASYEPPQAIGSLTGTGANRERPAQTPSRRRSPTRRPTPKRPARTTTPPSTIAPRTPPWTPPPTTGTTPPIPPATHPPAPRHTGAPHTAGPKKSEAPEGTGTPTASLPEFAVCLSFYQLARTPNREFRSLPRNASLHSRAEVAKSYDDAYHRMMRVLERSGLPRRDVVWVDGNAVAQAMEGMSKELPTGQGVSNRAVRAAFVKLSEACSR
jgi:hypothetical protein